MESMREKIQEKGACSGLDMQSELCMIDSLPWKKVWLSFEIDVLEQQKQLIKFLAVAVERHKLMKNFLTEK